MLGLADVQLDIVALWILSDDHAAVDLFTRSNKEGTAILSIEQTVSQRLAGFKGDERTGLAVGNIALIWTVFIEKCI